MNAQKREKLNQTLRHWPVNGLRTTASLRAQGISSALLHHYVQRHWLEQVERGVYRRPGDAPGWQAALYTIQTAEKLPVHVGGLTALELQGYGHYTGERPLFFYGPPRCRLPAWFEGAVGRTLRFTRTNFLSDAPQESLHSMSIEGVPVTVSTPERAALEMLYHVPGQVGFAEALEVVGGLAALRVEIMQILLESCSSVKAKRLFLYCAREAGHSWYPAFDRSRIDLGAGKRELVKGGKLDKEFLLTVAASPYTAEIRF
jgi:hypothetical protein